MANGLSAGFGRAAREVMARRASGRAGSAAATPMTDLQRQINADPRAFGPGIDRRTFTGNNPVQDLEAFAVNESRDAATGGFRAFRDRLLSDSNLERVEERASEARGLASRVSDVAAGTLRRRTETFDLSDRQKRAASRITGLNRAVTVADAGSRTRRNITDVATASRQAGAGFEEALIEQEESALTNFANAYKQRTIREAQERADKKAARNNMIGQAVGTAISLVAMFSSEELKDKIEDGPSLLDKLSKVRVDKWKYKEGPHNHIGPYAEEFNDAFGVNQENRQLINLVDAVGVALGSIKELDKKVEALHG